MFIIPILPQNPSSRRAGVRRISPSCLPHASQFDNVARRRPSGRDRWRAGNQNSGRLATHATHADAWGKARQHAVQNCPDRFKGLQPFGAGLREGQDVRCASPVHDRNHGRGALPCGDKSRVGGVKMSVVDGSIADAKRWSDFMLHKKFRGPGDNIERAAYEAETTWGAPASIMLRLRNREVTDMLLSNWVKLKAAYDAACLQVERQAEHQREFAKDAGINETNSRLLSMAARMGGTEDGAAK